MEMHDTKCCAIQEIHNLRLHMTPHEAMLAFCRLNIVPANLKFGNYTGTRNALYSFYFFTDAVPTEGKEIDRCIQYYGSSEYGTNFMAFIKENDLGDVWQSTPRINKFQHPGHSNHIYVWTPNTDALRAWWAKNKPEPPKPVEVPKPATLESALSEIYVLGDIRNEPSVGEQNAVVRSAPDL